MDAPIPLKSEPAPPDSKMWDIVPSLWALTRKELLLWVTLVVLLPMLAWARLPLPGSSGKRLEVRVAGVSPDAGAPSLARLPLNTVTAGELELLPGMGPSRARALLGLRARKGRFRNLDELSELRDFSPAFRQRLEGFLQIETDAP